MDQLTVTALRAKAGDRRCVDMLVAELLPDVWRMCRYLGSPADPDDLTQEAFERMLRSLPGFRGDGAVRSWALSITRRVCADSARRAVRRRRLEHRLALEHDPAVHGDDSWHEIDDLLAPLDADRREAFVLTQLVGLSYEEAAAAVNCPVGTIRSRVARARTQLLEDGSVDAALTG
jgi:RNA polymerase sigma-70 factor (ECF subfamily)